MVESLTQFRGTQIEWTQPRTLERTYELRAGESLLGKLIFPSMWKTLATAETTEGRWSFERVGVLHPRVTIRAAGQEEDLVVYEPRFWGDGMLNWPDGRSFTWKPLSFWATEWTLTDAAGQVVLKFIHRWRQRKLADALKLQATVELQQVEAYRDLLPVLLPFGMYLLVLRRQDAAAR